MGAIHVPTLLEGILEATAAKAQAEARITTLRATLEDVARRRYASEGAAPSWHTPQLGKVRLDPAGEWEARVADEAAFGSYVAEHHPTEATVAVHLNATDAADALQALEFIGVTPVDTRVEVRPAWSGPFLKALAVDVTEDRDDSAQVTRTVVAADTTTGNIVPGIGVTRAEAKLVVSLDRDRRTAAITEARATATALVEAASGDTDDAPAELAALDVRRRELEALHADQLTALAKAHGLGSSGTKAALAERIARAEVATGNVIRPASTLDAPERQDSTVGDLLATFVQAADPALAADLRAAAHPLPDGTEVEEVTTLPAHEPEPASPEEAVDRWPADEPLDVEELAEAADLVAEVDAAPEVTLTSPVEEVPDSGDVADTLPDVIEATAAYTALDDGYSREALRQHAKRLSIPASGTKADVIVRLLNAGHTAATLTEQEPTP